MELGQRLYMVFSRGTELRFLSHLDMMRLWERAMRRADLPLRYSQGYHPRPRLSLALPLAVGMTAAADWLEVELRAPIPPDEVCARLAPQLPTGIRLLWVGVASAQTRSLTALLEGAEYEAIINQPPPRELVQERVQQFMQAETWMVQEEHKGKQRSRDLRKGVVQLEMTSWGAERGHLRMRLRHNSRHSARPATVLRLLRISKNSLLYRKRLLFQDALPVPGEEVICADE